MDFIKTNDKMFSAYLNSVLGNFEIDDNTFKNQNFEVNSSHLLFFPKEFCLDFELIFDEHLFLKINYNINTQKYPKLKAKLFESLHFLFQDKRFFYFDDTKITLKSELSESELQRAKMFFFAEQKMNTLFYPETQTSMTIIAKKIFFEFRETMSKIWKTLYENFEMYDVSKIPAVIERKSVSPKTGSLSELPLLVDWFYKQKNNKIQSRPTAKREKNWTQKTYVFLKKQRVF